MALFGKSQQIDPNRELQREILQKEREYKEGLNTLKDIIAPAAFRVGQNVVEISGTFARSFFVLSYPRFVSVDWLSPIINTDAEMDMAQFIYPMATDEIMKKLKSQVGRIEASMRISQEKGNVRDPMMQTAFQIGR